MKEKNLEVERETLSAGFWDPNYPVGVTVFRNFSMYLPFYAWKVGITHKSMLFSTIILSLWPKYPYPLLQKKLHGYTSNRFEHTALNLEYFAF